MPFRFLDEIATADVAFEAWGKTREEMFLASAAALLRTMTDDPGLVKHGQELEIQLDHVELDMLLFSFLQELIFLKDARRLLLHIDRVRINGQDPLFHLRADASGEEISPTRHRLLVDVKAVTLHRFQVDFDGEQWKCTVVLDV